MKRIKGESKAFCVIELNDTRGPAVWGVGGNKKEAIEEAVKWASAFSLHHSDYDIEDEADLLNDVRFHVYPCSTKVYRKVEEYGGEINFVIKDDCVILPKELPTGSIGLLRGKPKRKNQKTNNHETQMGLFDECG